MVSLTSEREDCASTQPRNTTEMKAIDLTTPEAALTYLRSLPGNTEISLPGAGETKPDPGPGDAVAKITGESANAWSASMNRWEWTAAELVAALANYHGITTHTNAAGTTPSKI